VTVHGFRSSFRDSGGNETAAPREIVETALADAVGDTTEQAYRRSDALEKRRQLMRRGRPTARRPRPKGRAVQGQGVGRGGE
jgi:hypothetical protein